MRFPADWTQIEYLAAGSPRQRAAYLALRAARVMEKLAPFSPVLAGTIPLQIDLPESDLDILCHAPDPDRFAATAVAAFGDRPDFTVDRSQVGGLPCVVASFAADGFMVELFAQPLPVERQNGYRHMVVEARLLALAGEEAASAIRALKAQGLKTEPAFGRYFGLAGDPYQALLDLADAPCEALRELVAQRPR